jgi:SAM-dependent methyltransferase
MLSLLEPYRPQLPMNDLVEEVNRLFHEFEAEYYDQRHPDVFERGVPLWRDMIAAARGQLARPWRVLDFGCGTGFASQQIMANLPLSEIESLTCYDLSPAMLTQCRQKVALLYPRAKFTDDLASVREHGPFDVLATNGVLHHLPDPLGTIRELGSCLTGDAFWLAGHEPSCRYYRNDDCRGVFERFKLEQSQPRPWSARIQGALSPARLRKWWDRAPSPKKRTAQAVVHRGLFGKKPPLRLVDRLVDFHVAHSLEEADAGRGFDHQVWQASLRGEWDLLWVKSFAYMGPVHEATLPPPWRAACAELAAQFPLDGANFSTVWRRCG